MRTPAKKIFIEDIQKGEFREATGSEPAHIVTPWGEEAARVRILGTIVEKHVDDGMSCFLALDDGTGVISVRSWREPTVKKLKECEIGEIIDVIGRVREFAGEVYVIPEIVIKVSDPNAETLRILEIVGSRRKNLGISVKQRVVEDLPRMELVEMSMREEVKKAIKRLDKGEGVPIEEIAKELGISELEAREYVYKLLSDCLIYEFREGRYKVVI